MEKLTREDLKDKVEKQRFETELSRKKEQSKIFLFIGLVGLLLVALGFIIVLIVYYVIYSNLFI